MPHHRFCHSVSLVYYRTASDQRPIKLSDQPPSSGRSVHSPVIMDGAKSVTPQPTSSNNIKRHASFHGILPSKKEDLVRSGSHVSIDPSQLFHWNHDSFHQRRPGTQRFTCKLKRSRGDAAIHGTCILT